MAYQRRCDGDVHVQVRIMLFALVLACGTAEASEWGLVGGTDQGHRGYIDTASVRVSGNIRRAWIRSVVAP